MRRAIMVPLVLALAFVMAMPSADARRRRKKRRRSTYSRIIRHARPPRRVYRSRRGRPVHVRRVYRRGVWVVEPVYHETVVVHHTAPPPPVVVEERRPRPRRRPTRSRRSLGLLMKVGGLAVEPANPMTGSEDMNLGTVGLALRFRLDRHWAMELSAEMARGQDRDYTIERQTMPLTASLVLNLLPDSVLNIYGLAGAGVHLTQVDSGYHGYSDSYQRTELHVGGGGELKLAPGLRLFSEVRFMALGQESDRSYPGTAVPAPVSDAMEEGDNATQFNIGMALYF